MSECIKVMVRVRPLNDKEKARGNYQITQISDSKLEVTVSAPGNSFYERIKRQYENIQL